MISTLKVRRMGIDTYRENIVYMPVGCELCKSQGFRALSKIEIHYGKKSILASLNMTENGLVRSGEIGLSNIAFERLGARKGAAVTLSHPNPLLSTEFIRKKLEGDTLSESQMLAIVRDIAAYRYSNIELTAFVVACAQKKLSENEIVFLTKAMIKTGSELSWKLPLVLDKHCIGGIPGNRTSMIIVPIVAAFGLPMPKTSSRAITSPAGTADTMGAISNVQITLAQMSKIVRQENACIVWGGSLSLAPVDDIIISVERPLSIDSEGQMIASILSKKKAAGATHVLLDIPIGPTAKVRSRREYNRLKLLFENVGKKIGLHVLVLDTDGRQPIGRGIGPALEAMDVWQVLRNDPAAPQDLKEKSLCLAGKLLEMSRQVRRGRGMEVARDILESGKALEKFMRISLLQGDLKRLDYANFSCEIKSRTVGRVASIHNQKIAKVAKLAGAPSDARAGVLLHKKVGDKVGKNEPLFAIFSENKEELQFAAEYVRTNDDIITISQ